VVDTSPIHLQILAHAGNGLLLGNIVTGKSAHSRNCLSTQSLQGTA